MPERRRARRKPRTWVRVLRWTIAAAAMAATWYYGAWKGGSLLWMSLPLGVLVMVCTAAALTIPIITSALVAVAFIYRIDSGLGPALQMAAAALIVIGLAVSGWRLATRLRERDRRR